MIFLLTFVGCTTFLILTTIAMVFYAGGTLLDSQSVGYQFHVNFFSDLGRTEGYNGKSNSIAQILFSISAIFAGLMLIPYFIKIPAFLSQDTGKNLWLKGSSIIATIAACGYAAIGMFPADIMYSAHIGAVMVAFLLSVPPVVIIGIAMIRSPTYPQLYGYLYLGFTGLIIGYISVMFSYLEILTVQDLMVQVIGQKIIIYSEMIMMDIQAIGAYRFHKQQID